MFKSNTDANGDSLTWLQSHFFDISLISDKQDKKVWKAYSTEYKQFLAVKHIKLTSLEEFNSYTKQILNIYSLYHKTLCKIFDYNFEQIDTAHFEIYYAMEFAESLLDQDFNNGACFGKPDILVFLRNSTEVLQFLDSNYMITHRNLTPQNIMKLDGRYILKEFGLKYKVDPLKEKSNPYLAPEHFDQAIQNIMLDYCQADVYSLGVVVFKMCGIDVSRLSNSYGGSQEARDFEHNNALGIITKNYGADLAELVEKLTEKRPLQRITFSQALPNIDSLLTNNRVDIRLYESKKEEPLVNISKFVLDLKQSMKDQYIEFQTRVAQEEIKNKQDEEKIKSYEMYGSQNNMEAFTTDYNINMNSDNNTNPTFLNNPNLNESMFKFTSEEEEEMDFKRKKESEPYTIDDFSRGIASTGSWKMGLVFHLMATIFEYSAGFFTYAAILIEKGHILSYFILLLAVLLPFFKYGCADGNWTPFKALVGSDYYLYTIRSGNDRYKLSKLISAAKIVAIVGTLALNYIHGGTMISNTIVRTVLVLWILKESLRSIFFHFGYRFDHYYGEDEQQELGNKKKVIL